MDVKRPLLVERCARLALVAGVVCGGRVLAVDSLGEDACTGGLAYATRTAEQIGVGQLSPEDGVLQGAGDIILAYQCPERIRTIFPCRYNVL